MTWGRTKLILGAALIATAGLTVTLHATGPAEAAPELPGSTHQNDRWGYKVRAPKNWDRRAVKLGEKWIADKFFPAYHLRGRNETGEFIQHKPDLWVIGFPHHREEGRVKKTKVGENAWFIEIRNPYKDYKDFVKRESWASTGAGGWFYSREDKINHNDFEVDVYEIKVEKLVRAPLRVITWVYHCDDVDFAVQVRILEEQYEASKNAIETCLKSFRQIPRTEKFPEDEEKDIPREGSKERAVMTLDELNALRADKVENRIAREKANLPKGWRMQDSKHFITIANVDKKYTNYVLNFAESIRSYLDKHFKHIGPAKIPRGVIRVFSDSAEEHAYQQGTRSWWTDEVGEITMTYGNSGILSEFSWLAGRLTDQYFHIKNENLKNGMPGWIRHGIWGHVQWARPSKRKRMVLAPMPRNIISVRRMIASDEHLALRDLMFKSTSDYNGFGNMEQASSVVYWLLHRGNKGKTKGAIATYLKSLEDIIKEEDEKFERSEAMRRNAEIIERANQALDDAGKSDEQLEKEEEEAFRERRQNRNTFGDGMKSKFESIRERALKAAFGELSEKDWATLNKRWLKFANG